jgi:ABC-type multidrug transport system ATPase subunit
MEIHLNQLSKRYGLSHWVIRSLSFRFVHDRVYGISGSNGAGKTTLLSILAGTQIPSKGLVQYLTTDGSKIQPDQWFRYFTMAAPYADLYEYLTIREQVLLFQKFKGFIQGQDTEDVLRVVMLDHKADDYVKNLSSGMKQRLKLGLALLSNSEIVLLDEPLTNLDAGIRAWYADLLQQVKSNRLIIIASNESEDFKMVDEILDLKG